jgi:hypothetical protein
MKYNAIITALAEGLSAYFDEVYFDAELITNGNGLKLPAIPKGADWLTLEPTDQQERIYIRRKGDDDIQERYNLGSETFAYNMKSTLRIVYFRDRVPANEAGRALHNMMRGALAKHTKLLKIIRDKWKLLKEESSGDYTFGPDTLYFAIDVTVMWDLIPETCEQDFCVALNNPLKKVSCPVVA